MTVYIFIFTLIPDMHVMKKPFVPSADQQMYQIDAISLIDKKSGPVDNGHKCVKLFLYEETRCLVAK